SPQHPAAPAVPPAQRLPRVAGLARVPVPATSQRQAPAFPLEITVRGLPRALREGHGGVLVARTDGRHGELWLPWRGTGSATSDAVVLTAQLAEAGDHVFHLALSPESGAHGYLTRQTLACSAATATVAIDAAVVEATFRLPAGAQRSALLLLARPDDPHWIPIGTLPSGLELTAGGARRLWLGAGAYELFDPLSPERRQSFTIPGDADLVLSANLAAPRAGRP
ncbi:MAG: hypothetical protein WAT39_16605, partial [Planctomycetota bacterium]